jgi:hypothetical protein
MQLGSQPPRQRDRRCGRDVIHAVEHVGALRQEFTRRGIGLDHHDVRSRRSDPIPVPFFRRFGMQSADQTGQVVLVSEGAVERALEHHRDRGPLMTMFGDYEAGRKVRFGHEPAIHFPAQGLLASN